MELIGYLLHFIHVYDYTSLGALIINTLHGCTRGQIRLLRVGPPTCVILSRFQPGLKDLFLDPFHKQGGVCLTTEPSSDNSNKKMSKKTLVGLKEEFVNIWFPALFGFGKIPGFRRFSHVTGSGPPSYWLFSFPKLSNKPPLGAAEVFILYDSTFWISKLWGGLYG